MHTHTRAGSKVRIHVDGDWGGMAIIAIERHPANQVDSVELRTTDLLLGQIPQHLAEQVHHVFLYEAVSIAVEAYMHEKAAGMLDDLFLPEIKEKR